MPSYNSSSREKKEEERGSGRERSENGRKKRREEGKGREERNVLEQEHGQSLSFVSSSFVFALSWEKRNAKKITKIFQILIRGKSRSLSLCRDESTKGTAMREGSVFLP